MAGEEKIVGGGFQLEGEISFALIDWEFREKLFGMLFPVNFLNKERVRTLPPGFPLLALGFLFSELKCPTCHFPAVHQMGYALSSTWHRALGSNLCLPDGDVVLGRGEMFQNKETSNWPGVSVPTLSLLESA